MADLTLHVDLSQLKALEASLLNISKGMNVSAKDMGKTITKNMGEAKKAVSGFSTALSRMSFVMTATFSYKAYSTFITFLSDAVKETMLLEDSFDEIKSLLTSLGDEGDKLAGQFLKEAPEFAIKYARGLKEVTDGIYDTVSAGRVGADAMDSFEASAKLATVTNAQLDTTVRVLNRTLNAYGKSGEDAGEVSETLFKIIQKGMVRMDELERPFGKLVGTAGALGIELNKVASDFATIVRQLPSRESATALVRAFRQLSEIPDFAERLRKGGLLETVKILNEMPQQMFRDMFGSDRALTAGLAILNDMKNAQEGYNYFLEETNYLDDEFADKTDNASFRLKKQREELKANTRVLGKELIPILLELSGAVLNIVRPISKIIQLSAKLENKMGTLGRLIRFLFLQFTDLKGVFEFVIVPANKLLNKFFDLIGTTDNLTKSNKNLSKSFDDIKNSGESVASQTFDMIASEISLLLQKQKEIMRKSGGIIVGQEPEEYKKIEERLTILRSAYEQLFAGVESGNVTDTDLRGLLELLGYIKPASEDAVTSTSEIVDSLKEYETQLQKIIAGYKLYIAELKVGRAKQGDFDEEIKNAVEIISFMDSQIASLKKQGVSSTILDSWKLLIAETMDDLGLGIKDSASKIDKAFNLLKARFELATNEFEKQEILKEIVDFKDGLIEAGNEIKGAEVDKWLDSWAKGFAKGTDVLEESLKRSKLYLELSSMSTDKFAKSLGKLGLSVSDAKIILEGEIDSLETFAKSAELTDQETLDLAKRIIELRTELERLNNLPLSFFTKIKDWITQYNTAISEITSQVSAVWNSFWDFQTSRLNEYYNRKFDLLEEDQEKSEEMVNNSVLTEEHRRNAIAALDRKYADEREALEAKKAKKLAKLEKKKALYNMAIDYASGLINIWSTTNPVLASIFTGILTSLYGAQLAFVNSTKFAKGGVLKGASHDQGGIPLGNGQEAEGGEPILTKGVSKNPFLLKMASLVNQMAGGIDFAGTRFTPVMASGGIVRDTGVSNKVFTQMLQAISSFQPVVLSGVSDRDIYRASVSGRPRGAF